MMDFVNDNLIYIVPAGIAAVLYVAWEIVNSVRSRRSRRAHAPARPKQPRWWQFRQRGRARQKAPAHDEDDFHADAAAQITRRLEEQAREAAVRHEERMAEVTRTVEKARRLVEQSGIGSAAVDLLSTMWNWPVEARSPDWSRPAGLYELEYRPPEGGEVLEEGQIKVLTWLWDGSPYRLELSEAKTDAEEGAPAAGALVLAIDDETVLALDVGKAEPDREDLWTVSDVTALRAGHWMVEFAAFSSRLKMAEEEKRRQLEFERVASLAERIDLGDFDEDKVEEDGEQARNA